ncbi:MAG: hypothetical protein NTU50_03930 [Actinobacteria bacterium]|nr:hypothetical protein [Actinomycetota bacterium]
MKNLFKKSSPVAWFLLGILVAGGTGTAYAANGGTFRLGQSNSATATTKLTNTKGTALKVISKAGTPPINVGTNSTKVPYFNADKLDGKDSSQFQTKITPLTFTALTPATGWVGNCYAGAPGVAKSADGVVRFRGDICAFDTSVDPASNVIFTLPAQFRPTEYEYLITGLCNPDGVGPRIGRIVIGPGGVVSVEDDWQDTGVPKASTCFISLSGLTYALPY